MTIDFELREHLDALQDTSSYEIQNDHDPSEEDPERLLEAAVEAVAESSESIMDQEVFDVYRSLLKHSSSVPGTIMSKLLDSISSGLQTELDATVREVELGDQHGYMSHKLPLEMYAFLLQWFVTAAEKVKAPEDGGAVPPSTTNAGTGGKRGRGRGRGAGAAGRTASRAAAVAARRVETWSWIDQIPQTLALISRVLRLQTQRIWTTTAERETFINCLTRPAYHITESEQYMKSQEIKLGVYKIICLAVKHHGHFMAAQITIMQHLQFYEHLSEPMAECLTILAKEFDHAQLGDEILREIAAKTFNSQDNKGPRAFARFLTKFAELAPRSILKQLSLLLGQLDSEAYPLRIAIVESIGYLINELANSGGDDGVDKKQLQKQIAGLYDLLLERMMDTSSYVRVKVLAVLSRLCDLRGKFPKQRLAITRAAIASLEDKIATVRKASTALLVKLLLTHPYGLMHGGYLELEVWEAEYLAVKEELAKVEGKMGKAVEIPEGEGEGQEDEEDDEEDDEEAENDEQGEGTLRKKKSKRARAEGDMDVDGEGGDTESEDESQNEDSMEVDDEDAQATPVKKKTKRPKLAPRRSQLDVTAVTNEQAALAALQSDELLHLRLRKKYYAEALNFIRQIEGAMDIVCQLLGSTSKAEVLEAMDFFRVAHEYKFESAKVGIKKMLHLIWNKDNSTTSEDGKELKGIRSRLLECYRSLYFDPLPDTELDAKGQVNRIAKNMVERTYDATLAELTSLEEMMRIMMEEGDVHPDIISKLWQVYSADRALPKPQRRGAIIILGMLALAKRNVLTDRVDTMLKVGLGSLGRADLTLARYTCVALQRLAGSTKKVKGSLLDKSVRFEMDNPIFRKLQAAIEAPCRSKDWFGLAEQAINTIYALGEHPDELCTEVIKKLAVRAFNRSPRSKSVEPPASQAERDPDAMDEDQLPESTQMSEEPASTYGGEKPKDVADAFELSQLLFVVGHVALKHIAYLELVERELKRQKDENQAAEKAAKANNQQASKEGEELDQVAGNAEDEIGDRVAAIRESELLYGPESLLALFGPLIVHICGSPHKFKNRTLRAAATLSFSKFLCVSSQFCDQHHRLLFKILETSRDANIRSNIVIALGDVAVSFSNIIDENNNELYKGLSDPDLVVKKNTLMVLTHLILNGMIKVKGQLGEMAKCLEDPEPRVADLAKLFFTQLSTKDNAIYNNLPDVISHLSTGEHAVEEPVFQSTLRYIFKFIEKEKQAENIVEKLCQRFRLTEEPRQWRDIAFCLSLLPFKSERSVKKLTEGFQFYHDKLHEPKVYELFAEILVKARANKSNADADLDEFEKLLEENKIQGEEDQALERRVGKKKAAAKKRAARKPRGKKAAQIEDEDEE